MGLTEQICQKAISHKFEDLPNEVVNYAKLIVLDNLGCAIRGLKEPLSKILAEELLGGPATLHSLLGIDNQNTHATLTARLYGATAHAIDFDDTLPEGQPTHTGSVVLGAILALLPSNPVSGKNVIEAVVAAYEANADIGKMLSGSHYHNGFHPTATVGVFAATIAAGRLLDLNLNSMRNALGIASTQAAGLKSTFGTMAKPFNAGQAASAGVLAASLANRGFTGPTDALEAERGYLEMFLGLDEGERPELESGRYQILGNWFKFYAACHATHPMIEALSTIKSENSIDLDDIITIETTAPELAFKTAAIQTPETGLECKFSFPQMAALTLAGYNPASDECFENSVLNDATVNKLRDKFIPRQIEMEGFDATTVVTLASGEKLEKKINLFSMMDDKAKVRFRLEDKFSLNTRHVLNDNQNKTLISAIMSLETAKNAKTVFAVNA